MTARLAFDAALCVVIVAVAVTAVVVRDAFAGIVFFIVYGLLVAIAWTRLGEVDVALAEAAIGAGLTGVLFVTAFWRLEGGAVEGVEPAPARPGAAALRLVLCGAVGGAVAVAVLALADGERSLAPLARENLALTGVSNPVTAVLLNFRGYDTLLESVVLLVALVAVWSLTPDRLWGGLPGDRQRATPHGVLDHFGRVLAPTGVVVGLYLVWIGSSQPGGAFQAGKVLAAVWLLAWMAGLVEAPRVSGARLRLLLVLGPGVFLMVGIAGALSGAFLGFHPPIAYALTLAIEIALAASIAATLALAVAGVRRRLP